MDEDMILMTVSLSFLGLFGLVILVTGWCSLNRESNDNYFVELDTV